MTTAPESPGHPRVLTVLLLGLLCLCSNTRATFAHPQDGPHADIRATIDEAGVRLSVGLNLAFIDEVIGAERESLQAVSEIEGRAISAELTRRLLDEVVVTIDAERISGEIDSHVLFTDPEPSLAAIYPRSGMRALMRATTLITYSAPERGTHPQRVEITWPFYPPDLLAAETEGAIELPPLVINVLMRAEGGVNLLFASQAEPTITWEPGAFDPDAGFVDVPTPPEPLPRGEASLFWQVFAVLSAITAIAVLARLVAGNRVWAPAVPVSLGVLAFYTALGLSGVWSPGFEGRDQSERVSVLPEEDAAAAFAALHANLYHAFDYTSEGEVYDALARSVRGPLLPELYDEVYRSLVQADQGGLQGIITAYEPQPPEILSIGLTETEGTERLSVRTRQAWTIDGTVYHWGHSHTVQTAYTAEYRMDATTDGWRIVEHRITSQRVATQPGETATPANEPAIPDGEI